MNRFEHDPLWAIQYEEMVSPKHHPNRWTHKIHDLGLDVTDFSFWLAADLQILMEWQNNKWVRVQRMRQLPASSYHTDNLEGFTFEPFLPMFLIHRRHYPSSTFIVSTVLLGAIA
jgi:hypothetical protein